MKVYEEIFIYIDRCFIHNFGLLVNIIMIYKLWIFFYLFTASIIMDSESLKINIDSRKSKTKKKVF